MFQIPLLNIFVIILINIVGLWLSFWVWSSNKKAIVNQLVVLWTIPILLMLDFGYLSNISFLVQYALFFKKLRFASTALFFVAGYFFYVYFPKTGKRNYILDKIHTILWLFLFCLSAFTPLIIKDIKLTEFGTDVIFGKGIFLYYSITIFSVFLFLYILFKKYFYLSKEERLKVQYFLVGVVLFAIFNLIFNVVFPIIRGAMQYYQLGDYSLIFLLGFTAYAIVKRQLFGIKVVLTTLLVGLIAILLAFDALVLTENLFFQFVKGIALLSFLVFGYLLIKSVLNEIKRREELENLTSQLEVVNIKLTSAYKKLERLDKTKSEFISIASHQLRTPLTAVKGYISMILEKTYGKPPEKMEKPLENIYASNERLIKLVNDLLSISRIEAGRIEMEIEEFSLEEIINSVVEELKNVAQKNNIYLRFEKPQKPLPKVLADKDQIRQVIMNVIDNGIRYTEKGGITINTKVLDSRIQVRVSDTGEGMIKEEISKLFESFSRGTAGARFWTEGAGLGLYVAKKFMNMHKGRIRAESPGKGKGSTFYIELPLK